MATSKRFVGIDFGTSTTLIAARTGAGQPRVLPLGRQTPWLPSIVGIDESGKLIVGEAAADLPVRSQIRSAKASLTSGQGVINAGGTSIPTRDAIGALLSEAVTRARAVNPDVFDNAQVYLGCPALWTGSERRLLADVALEAGLEVDISDIIDEPVAAGLHAVHSRLDGGETRIDGKTVVFDAGGGTLDIAYLDVADGDVPTFTVLSAEGIPRSGDALDERIARDLHEQVALSHDDALLAILLRLRAREIKEGLTLDLQRSTPLGAPFKDVLKYSRAELEHSFEPLLAEANALVQSAVRGSQLRVLQPLSPTEIRQMPWAELGDDVRHVVLAGGMSQIPAVARQMSSIFGRAEIAVTPRPQEAVVLGLAQGDRLDRLNLPRPPVTFMVEFGPPEAVERLGMPVRIPIYEAFTPIYSWADLMTMAILSYRRSVPVPSSFEELTCRLTAVAPDRTETPLTLAISSNGQTRRVRSFEVSHRRNAPATFILYTNGDLIFTGARGERLTAKVHGWPHLRGPRHDWNLEIKLTLGNVGPYRSSLPVDDWRFN